MSVILLLALTVAPGRAAGLFNILDYAPAGEKIDQTGKGDASPALINAITAANVATAKGEPACVYIPPGVYRIRQNPPQFARAGCVKGEGASLSILLLDKEFAGDLFTWSEAWYPTTPGPRVVGLTIRGDRQTTHIQNALVFYDRNDEVFLDDIEIDGVNGRALYSGVTKHVPQAYMREAHMRSLRFSEDGAPGVPVVEFNSQGVGKVDATNEITVDQLDIYGAYGPSLVIRNAGESAVRNLRFFGLRIEGKENGAAAADLVTIGDKTLTGSVNNIQFVAAELIDPYKGFAALRMTGPNPAKAPYQITFQGSIGGGLPHGQGLRIDAGRTSTFRFSAMHTLDTNVVIGPTVSGIILDGGGQENGWTYQIDPIAARGIFHVNTAQVLRK
jgi:hypothetical protein